VTIEKPKRYKIKNRQIRKTRKRNKDKVRRQKEMRKIKKKEFCNLMFHCKNYEPVQLGM
jgi:hypothetical protein